MRRITVDVFGFPSELYGDSGSCSPKLSTSPFDETTVYGYDFCWSELVAIYGGQTRFYIVGKRGSEFFRYDYSCYDNITAVRMAKDFENMIKQGEA